MIIRNTKVVTTDGKEIYSSTCTIDGNTITGSQNPWPYIQRMVRRKGLHIIGMNENGQSITLIVK